MKRRGQIISARAKRVLYPAYAVWLCVFVSFVADLIALGTSAFPGGRIEGARHFVVEHGKTIDLTAGQFWLSYTLGISVVAVLGVLIAVFYWRGDLKDENRDI